MARFRQYICPSCKQRTGADIWYGYGGEDMAEAAERAGAVLGGCCFGPDSPERHCMSCSHEWMIKRRPIRFPDGTLVPPELLNGD